MVMLDNTKIMVVEEMPSYHLSHYYYDRFNANEWDDNNTFSFFIFLSIPSGTREKNFDHHPFLLSSPIARVPVPFTDDCHWFLSFTNSGDGMPSDRLLGTLIPHTIPITSYENIQSPFGIPGEDRTAVLTFSSASAAILSSPLSSYSFLFDYQIRNNRSASEPFNEQLVKGLVNTFSKTVNTVNTFSMYKDVYLYTLYSSLYFIQLKVILSPESVHCVHFSEESVHQSVHQVFTLGFTFGGF